MATLTRTQIDLLGKVISGSGPHPASENALAFRASNEDALDDLDELERLGLLTRANNRYFLSITGLDASRARNSAAAQHHYFCTHLFGVLRTLYKNEPGQTFSIDQLAKAADFPITRVRRGLSYLTQLPIWSGYNGPLDAIAGITPSEGILRFQDLDEAVASVLRSRNEGYAEPREKQQKFGILDSPTLLTTDLAKPGGILGRAVLYLDLDDFKKINTALTEVAVDKLILPPVHKLLAQSVTHVGSAYGEGGDEFTILLPNVSKGMALQLGREILARISALRFEEAATSTHLTVSIGIAHAAGTEDGLALRERANIAKNHAKEKGKNQLSLWSAEAVLFMKAANLNR
jgi:diguanylate cyclase (GGDEF)-like protein